MQQYQSNTCQKYKSNPIHAKDLASNVSAARDLYFQNIFQIFSG